MNPSDLDHLESLYEAIQSQYQVSIGSPELADAVHFGTNRSRPVHRWFHFKEGFSADLFGALGLDTTVLEDPDSLFLDPFCGSGTTLVAGDLEANWQGKRIGVEINPFIAFIASTKVAWREYDPRRMSSYIDEVLSPPLVTTFSPPPRPGLSTFDRSDIFLPDRLSTLLEVVHRIKTLDVPESAPLLLGVAAAAERVGFYRKDGRALRILKSQSELRDRLNLTVEQELRRRWSIISDDLRQLGTQRWNGYVGQATVVVGDGRAIELPSKLAVGPGDVSLIAYSPPYLNHIDYTEVYKIELWLLGFIRSKHDMLALRKRTLRSHGSVGIVPATVPLPPDVSDALALATGAVYASDTPWHRTFPRLASAYLGDMYESLQRQFTMLRPGGIAVCVVGNSAHGTRQQRVPIAADLFIAKLAELAGFDVEQFVVARQLRRRDHLNRFLRETVIVLRRPGVV